LILITAFLLLLLCKIKETAKNQLEKDVTLSSDVKKYNKTLRSELESLFGIDAFMNTSMEELLPTKLFEVENIRSKVFFSL
jgi:hypothetical protein